MRYERPLIRLAQEVEEERIILNHLYNKWVNGKKGAYEDWKEQHDKLKKLEKELGDKKVFASDLGLSTCDLLVTKTPKTSLQGNCP